jgi:gluconolactonase
MAMALAQPRRLRAKVFSALPDTLRRDRVSAWSERYLRGRSIDSFLEGPVFTPSGDLLVTDIPNGRIFEVSPAGRWSVRAGYDGWPNGLALHRDGRLFIADARLGLLCLAQGKSEPEPLVTAWRGSPFLGLNDLVIGSDGSIYVTDQGLTGHQDPRGRVFRVSPDGSVTCLLQGVPSPNGIALAADESALLLAVTRANAVWRLPFDLAGEVVRAGTFLQLSGGGGPDGLALHRSGALILAQLGIGVMGFDQVGWLSLLVEPPERSLCTNLVFHPTEPDRLYVTESQSGRILAIDLEVAQFGGAGG